MAARILVIDDHANMDLMIYLLQAFGHTVLSAWDGKEGLEISRRQHPDLSVCDIHLPTKDGYGVAAALKKDTALAAIPLLGLTALAMAGDREKILEAGFLPMTQRVPARTQAASFNAPSTYAPSHPSSRWGSARRVETIGGRCPWLPSSSLTTGPRIASSC